MSVPAGPRIARVLLLALFLTVVFQSVYYYPRLPDRVASHFGTSGAADGWSSKEVLVGVHLLVGTLAWAIFTFGSGFMRRVPRGMINLPHKDHWLSPAERPATLAFLEGQLSRIGVATMILLILVQQSVVQANLDPEERLSSSVGWVLVVYFVYIGVWTVRLFLRFRRPRAA